MYVWMYVYTGSMYRNDIPCFTLSCNMDSNRLILQMRSPTPLMPQCHSNAILLAFFLLRNISSCWHLHHHALYPHTIISHGKHRFGIGNLFVPFCFAKIE